jgi:dipeptidyl-peptidase-3
MKAEIDLASPCYYVHDSEVKGYKACVQSIGNITTAVHELLGHGSGKLLSEISPDEYNFDRANPPINPLTGERISTWYLPGQTWTSVFGKMAAEVEECRAEVMSMYLMDNKDILSMFGHDDTTPITPDGRMHSHPAHPHPNPI